MKHPDDFALVLHGGAGPTPGRDYSEVESHLSALIRDGEAQLEQGRSALDVVETMVADMERSGLYVAGRGSAANASGVVEMDASIMDGSQGRAGGVASVRDLANPVRAARAVMEQTPHVLLAGEGADMFCKEAGLERTDGRTDWYRLPVGVEEQETRQSELAHGTVGAVARDQHGRLAAATSTGGLFGKRAGRVGDTPLIGVGTWADQHVAISCTGIGEAFMRCNAAYDLAARMKYAGTSLQEAAQAVLKAVAALGGDGGLIAINSDGQIVMPFNSDGMKRAWVRRGEPPQVAVFAD
jgi:isoaspartyl peptidase/L-asparaginase-like protein (Ntn-hydrolase superfamily)